MTKVRVSGVMVDWMAECLSDHAEFPHGGEILDSKEEDGVYSFDVEFDTWSKAHEFMEYGQEILEGHEEVGHLEIVT